jgi:hypothetical protein
MRRTDQQLPSTQARRPAGAGRVRRSARLQVEPLESRVVPTTVALGPSKDNTLYESATGALSNGAGMHFFAGNTATPQTRRGVIAFDVAGSIPAGSTITSVTLRLSMSRTISGPQTVALRRLLADWGEGTSDALGEEGGGAAATPGDATWVHRFFSSATWASPGGDFAPTASASISVGGLGFYTWGSTPAMVADVQAWLNTPGSNFGWLLLGNEASAATAKSFDTKENPVAANRPVLTVNYTAPAPPSDVVFFFGAVELLDDTGLVGFSGAPQGAPVTPGGPARDAGGETPNPGGPAAPPPGSGLSTPSLAPGGQVAFAARLAVPALGDFGGAASSGTGDLFDFPAGVP